MVLRLNLLLILLIIFSLFTSNNYAQQKNIQKSNNQNNQEIIFPALYYSDLAYKDAKTLPTNLKQFTRYILTDDPQAIILTLGYISRSSTLLTAKDYPIIGDPKLKYKLIRVNIQNQVPVIAVDVNGKLVVKDLENYIDTWEKLKYDPMFNLLITPDNIKLASQVIQTVIDEKIKINPNFGWHIEKVPEYTHSDGNRYTSKWVKDLVIHLNPLYLEPILSNLQNELTTAAPIIDGRYFLTRALSTIKDKGVFKEVFGGLYYDFIGLRKLKRDKGTDEDELFELLGLGNIEKGITANEIFSKLRSDQRIAIFRSKVTGLPRRVDWFQSPAGRDTVGYVFVTHDIRQQDVDIGTHPIANLLAFKDFAREIIFVKTNGLHGGALYNGDGVLQDEVPPDVAKDHMIPEPHHGRLQAMIGCIRCHNLPKDSLGMKPLRNDVKTLLGKNLKVFGDISDRNQLIPDTIDRLKGLYSGDPSFALMQARNDLAKSTLRATGPINVEPLDQTEITYSATAKITESYAAYNWNLLTPENVLSELGLTSYAKTKKLDFDKIVPPDFPSTVPELNLTPEDFRIASIREKLEIPRTDFSFVHSFIAQRAYEQYRKVNTQENQPVPKNKELKK